MVNNHINLCAMKYLSATLILLICTLATNSQSFDWAKSSGGNGSDRAYAIATDNNGNSYVTGWFQETAHFGDITLTSEGGKDVFLAKYNSNGEVQWAVKAWGIANNTAAGICMDWDDFPIITGWFAEDIHFGDLVLESNGSYDMFVARYNSNGDIIWARNAGGEGDDYGNRVTINLENDVLVSGSFRYTAHFGEEVVVTSEGNRDIFIANYSNTGNFHWVKRAGGAGEDRAYDIVSGPDGSTYFTGVFNGRAFFGDHDITSNSFLSTYVCKMNAGGQFLWVKKGSGGANDYARGFGIDIDSEGHIYSTGTFSGSLSYGEETIEASGGLYDFDIYLAKHNSSGNLLWIKKAGGYGMDQGFDIVVDNEGNSFVTGFFSSRADFGDIYLESAGMSDVFIVKYNWAGELQWVKQAGGDYQDYSYGISIGNTEENNVYICGNYQEEAAFDYIILSNWGAMDMFTAKLDYTGDFVYEQNHGVIKITPNPNNGSFNIYTNTQLNDVVIIIISADGKTVFKERTSSINNEIKINASLASGTYTFLIPELGISSKFVVK